MNRRDGFTLVEMLLTLGVLAIGLVVLFTLLPGIANYSRELRDRERMQLFAEDVFTALTWSLEPAAEENPVPESVKRTLATPVGTQEVVETDDWVRWPSDSGADALVPVLLYTLSMETTSPQVVEARLSVRSETLLTPEIFAREFTLSPPAW